MILRAREIPKLEEGLNECFDKGYVVSGGVTFDGEMYIAVVTKPF